jgi:tetratricopeptide (TPR) repeat protein
MRVLSTKRLCNSVVVATRHGRLLALAVSLMTFATAVAAEARQPANSGALPPFSRNIQAIPLPATSVDNQISWIIEPDVPRIPNIAGLDARLPPHVERRLSYAFDLAQRGATFSANAEFRAVLSLCALELDAREGGTSRREALRQAWLALDEADDFHGDRLALSDAAEIRSVAAAHETPVLNGAASPVADSIQAVQAYYAFAEQQFNYSCRGLSGASLAFYGLARTLVVPGTQVTHAAGKAATLQRVALAIAPQNFLAGNELGVLLAEHGQLRDAENLFRQCLALNPTPETWRNLAVVHARRGDRDASQSALAAADALEAKNRDLAHFARQPNAGDSDSADSTGSNGSTQKQGLFDRFNLSKLRGPFWR